MLRKHLAAERGFLRTGAARFVVRELRPWDDRKNAILLPELGRGFVYFLEFAKARSVRKRQTSTISDLLHCPSVVCGRSGELHLRPWRRCPSRDRIGQHTELARSCSIAEKAALEVAQTIMQETPSVSQNKISQAFDNIVARLLPDHAVMSS